MIISLIVVLRNRAPTISLLMRNIAMRSPTNPLTSPHPSRTSPVPNIPRRWFCWPRARPSSPLLTPISTPPRITMLVLFPERPVRTTLISPPSPALRSTAWRLRSRRLITATCSLIRKQAVRYFAFFFPLLYRLFHSAHFFFTRAPGVPLVPWWRPARFLPLPGWNHFRRLHADRNAFITFFTPWAIIINALFILVRLVVQHSLLLVWKCVKQKSSRC